MLDDYLLPTQWKDLWDGHSECPELSHDEEVYVEHLMDIDMEICIFELLTSLRILKKSKLIGSTTIFLLGCSLIRCSSKCFFLSFFLLQKALLL